MLVNLVIEWLCICMTDAIMMNFENRTSSASVAPAASQSEVQAEPKKIAAQEDVFVAAEPKETKAAPVMTDAQYAMLTFPDALLGMSRVDKYPNPDAKHVLVHIRQIHGDFNGNLNAEAEDCQKKIIQSIELLHDLDYVDSVYLEGLTDEVLESINDDLNGEAGEQFAQDYIDYLEHGVVRQTYPVALTWRNDPLRIRRNKIDKELDSLEEPPTLEERKIWHYGKRVTKANKFFICNPFKSRDRDDILDRAKAFSYEEQRAARDAIGVPVDSIEKLNIFRDIAWQATEMPEHGALMGKLKNATMFGDVKEILSLKREILSKREDYVLGRVATDDKPLSVVVFGAAHMFGDVSEAHENTLQRHLEDYTEEQNQQFIDEYNEMFPEEPVDNVFEIFHGPLENNIEKWNAANPDNQVSLIEITPEGV